MTAGDYDGTWGTTDLYDRLLLHDLEIVFYPLLLSLAHRNELLEIFMQF